MNVYDTADESSTRIAYLSWQKDDLLQKGIIASLAAIAIVPAFALLDIFVLGVDPRLVVLFRSLPILVSMVFLSLSLSLFKKDRRTVVFFYRMIVLALLVMMNGIQLLAAEYQQRDVSILVVIFICFVANLSGYAALIAMYASTSMAYVAVTLALGRQIQPAYSNCIVAMVVLSIMAIIQERMRYDRFRSGKIIERQNEELTEKNRLIGEKNERIETELALAREVQTSIIPAGLPRIEGVELSSLYIPLEEVGGDFFDVVIPDRPRSVGIFIGDVAGHGLPAALVTSMIKMLINTAGALLLRPAGLMEHINRNITGQTGDNFLTAFYCLYDGMSGTLRYARAGHPFPFLVRGPGYVGEIRSSGTILGVSPSVTIEEREIRLDKGDKLFLYTDGMSEAVNTAGDLFEGKVLREVLSRNAGLPVAEFIPAIFDEYTRFKQYDGHMDDICIIGMEIP